jgi:hypothetical protein
MTTPVDPASGKILSRDQFHAAIKAAQERFSLIRKKHPGLKGYLVIALAGGQTGIGSSEKEILKECPTLAVNNQAKADLVAFLKIKEPKDASDAEKKRLKEQYQHLAEALSFNGNHQVEIRFSSLSYELVWQLQSDELVDRDLTPQTQASIRIVLGTLSAFAP